MASDEIHADRRLTRGEFKKLIVGIANGLPGPDESFDYLVSFMNNSLKMSLAEQLRGSCRRRWLAEIQSAVVTAGLSLENVFRTAFQTIYKDAELHGDRKQVNVYVALAERVPEPERATHGDGLCLRYVAATPKDAHILLNKRLYKDMHGISLNVLETGRPIHVPRIAAHGNIKFWNTHRPKTERDGSFLCLPLKETSKKQSFGILGVDTLGDPFNVVGGIPAASFSNHEIKFYQGIAAALADAFRVVQHSVDVTDQLGKCVPLIFDHVPTILQSTVYLTELDPRTTWSVPIQQNEPNQSIVLRKVVDSNRMEHRVEQIGSQPARLIQEQNVFREYVFNAAATGNTVIKKSYAERRIAVPLRRPSDGRTVAVFDFGVRDPGKDRTVFTADGKVEKRSPPLLPYEEKQKVVRVLRIAQAAVGELSMEFVPKSEESQIANPKIIKQFNKGDKFYLLAETPQVAGRNLGRVRKALMLDRLFLSLTRMKINKYQEAEIFEDLRSIGRPNNETIQKFTAQLVGLVYPKSFLKGDLNGDWINCKVFLTTEMRERLVVVDPSHPRVAQFIVKRLMPETPSQEELSKILVTSRLQLLYEHLAICQRIATICQNLTVEAVSEPSPVFSLDTPVERNSGTDL